MQKLCRINHFSLKENGTHSFHSGQQYLMLFVLHGNCQFQAGGRSMNCLPPDMLLVKPEQTLPAHIQKSPCSILTVHVSVRVLAFLSDDTCDLVQKFQFAPYDVTVIHPEMKESMLLRNIITKMDKIKYEEVKLGTQLYEKSLFTAFLILFLRACVQSDQVHQTHQKKMLMIDEVFEYISQHLTEDLSLNTLEKAFFVSGEHISREFKKHTGMTLHAYITRTRIDLGKKYLLQGMSVQDVCQLCSFSSYNHFFRVFKKECGMTPMDYYRKFGRQPASGETPEAAESVKAGKTERT